MVVLALALLASAAVVRATPIEKSQIQLPLVIWHGLGTASQNIPNIYPQAPANNHELQATLMIPKA